MSNGANEVATILVTSVEVTCIAFSVVVGGNDTAVAESFASPERTIDESVVLAVEFKLGILSVIGVQLGME